MILDAIIGVLVSFLTALVGLLPAWELPVSITDLGGALGGAFASINGVFPVGTLGICLGMMVGVRLFVFAWGLIVWIYKLIPGKFT